MTVNPSLHRRQPVRDLNLAGLTDAITAAIEQSRAYDHDAVTVTSRGGIIVLTGFSKSCIEKQIALDLAWAVPGVTGIEDNLVLDSRGA
ncbi:BON domain-containing protein [Acetobacteraceae bacterium]|nr:BON domain-containing protein [Acetobacteraceae bacterium]